MRIMGLKKVILLGDSITQFSFSSDGCWGSMLADHLIRKCDVINCGFSGYNTRWYRLALPSVVNTDVAKDVAMATICLGANDSNEAALNERQHVPIEEYGENIEAIINYLETIGVGKEKVVLIGPPPVDEVKWTQLCKDEGRPYGKTITTTLKYANVCEATAKRCSVHYIDLHGAMMKSQDWKSYLNDGLHLSPSGSSLLFQRLKSIADQLTSHLPILMPDWKDVDLKNPSISFPAYNE